jgi:hypothetical protein
MNDEILLRSVERTLNESRRMSVINNLAFDLLIEEKEFDYLDVSSYADKFDQFGRDIGGEKGEQVARIGRNIGTGVAKSQAKKALAKQIVSQIAKRAAQFTSLTGKAIPLVGDVIAIIDGLIEGVIFAKSLKKTTELLIEKSGVELSGLGSMRGEYSILEANRSDMKKIADSLEAKVASGELSSSEVEEIREVYFESMRALKGLIINILMLAKYLGPAGPVAVATAIIAYVTPIELGAKELFYYLHTKVADFEDMLSNSDYGVLRFIDKVQSLARLPQMLAPLIGFLADSEKVRELGRIDDVLTGEFQKENMSDYATISGAEHIEDMKRSDSFSSAADDSIGFAFGKLSGLDKLDFSRMDYGKGLADLANAGYGQLSESKTNKNKLILERWQVLAGIN